MLKKKKKEDKKKKMKEKKKLKKKLAKKGIKSPRKDQQQFPPFPQFFGPSMQGPMQMSP